MLGNILVENLLTYFDGLSTITVPVSGFDANAEKELPCLILGYGNETPTMAGNTGHFTIETFAMVHFQGYEDPQNESGDAVMQAVIDGINTSTFEPKLSAGIRVNEAIIRGTSYEIEGSSSVITLMFDCFCGAKT